MKQNQSKLKAYLNLFTPSGLGVVMYVFLAFLIIVLNQFPDIKEYLEVPADFEFSRLVMGWLDNILTGTLGEGRTAALVVGCFWAIVGLAVYVFLQALAKLVYEIGEGVEQRNYVWPKGADRRQPLILVMERTVLRVVAFFALVFLLLQPLANLMKGVPFREFIGPITWLQYVVWFLCLILVLHLATVLARVVVLRERLFE